MNFKDKLFTTSLLIFLASLTGLIFPKFVMYIFLLGLAAGLCGIGYWVWKNKRGVK